MSPERGLTKTKLRPPEDGIVSSGRPGPVAARWLQTIEEMGDSDRLARGRALARSGRVRDLWFAPGVAGAEVHDTDVHQIAIRVRSFGDREWRVVQRTLASRLRFVAWLLEGSYDAELSASLEQQGVILVPGSSAITADCDCADFVMPCAHVVAVHHVLADALEGEPFLLFSLRGRDRTSLLSELRGRWGDASPLHIEPPHPADQPPPQPGDWTRANVPRPSLAFHFRAPRTACAGLRALGPAPENADLHYALGPLYAAGSAAALDNVLQDDDCPPPEEPPMTRDTPTSPSGDLTEAIVDLLVDIETGAKSKDLAGLLGLTLQDVRTELLELEKLGIVYRTGQTRGTRWWLG